MPTERLGPPRDPNFPEYAYAKNRMVYAYKKARKGSGVAAKLFLGEWVKIKDLQAQEWIPVTFRGGEGYVRECELTRTRHLEMFFIDVDQGDSILIQTPDDRRILIDGGKTDDAHQFIRNKYRLDKRDNYIDFEAIVATHSDNDHTEGLIKILQDKKVAVKRVFHNGLFRHKDKHNDPGPHREGKVFAVFDGFPTMDQRAQMKPLMNRFIDAAVGAKNRLPECLQKMKENNLLRWNNRVDFNPDHFVFKRLDTSLRYLPPFDDQNSYLTISVLWPHVRQEGGNFYLPWYGDAGYTVNGNSIVLQIQHGAHRILLTGDLNNASMPDIIEMYDQAEDNPLLTDVYKAAHHGSQHFTLDFLKKMKANAAVISSGDQRYDDHGHPRAVLLGTITRYSRVAKPAIFSTELAACFQKLSRAELNDFKKGKNLYERAIKGIIHLRSNGRDLYLGSVFGRHAGKDQLSNVKWDWDIWPENDE